MKLLVSQLFILTLLFFVTTSESCSKSTKVEKETTEETETKTSTEEPPATETVYWQEADTSIIIDPAFAPAIPKESRLLNLDVASLRSVLKTAPNEKDGVGIEACPIIYLPMPDGSTQSFRVFESHSMDPALAEKYELYSYTGQGIDDKTATLKCELSPKGFRAQILSTTGTIIIDPVKDGPDNLYVAHKK